jgi:hypothetical protein
MKTPHRLSALGGVSAAISLALLSILLANQGDITWQGVGIGGGGAWMGVTVSPLDSNQVLMGTDTGGIYRSGDGGLTWSNANTGAAADPAADAGWYPVESFAYDPNNSGTVYAGARHGVLKSTDGGQTWSKVVALKSLAVVAVDSCSNVIAASGSIFGAGSILAPSASGGLGCVYRSTNGGASWMGVSFVNDNQDCTSDVNSNPDHPNVTSIQIDPTNCQTLLLATNQGLYRSTNGGGVWTHVSTTGLPHSNLGQLAYDRTTGTLYAALVTQTDLPAGPEGYISPDSWEGGVYKSTNQGTTWGTDWTPVNGMDDASILPNGSFESGTGPAGQWGYIGNSAYVTKVSIPSQDPDDQYAIQVATPDYNQSFVGVISDYFPVTGGTRLTVSGKAKVINATLKPGISDASTFFGRILYFDSGGNAVPDDWCPGSVSWNNVWDASETQTGWRRYQSIVLVPEGATQAQMSLYTNDMAGTVLIDDIEVSPTRSLPSLQSFYGYTSSSYRALVADPTVGGTLWVGTDSANYGGVDGVFKSVDGGGHWTYETRHFHNDNVLDKRAAYEPNPSLGVNDPACQGGYPYLPVYGIGIGNGTTGHDSLFMTNSFFAYRKPSGTSQWEETTHDHFANDPYPNQRTLWTARGVTNNLATRDVLMSNGKVFLGDSDNLLQVTDDAGASFRQEGIDRYVFLWARDLGVSGGTVTSIIPDLSTGVYVAVAGDGGGVLHGTLSASSPQVWQWSKEGLSGYPSQAGNVHLARLNGTLYAAIGGQGVFRDDGNWVQMPDPTGVLPSPFFPDSVAVDATNGLLFVGTGDTYNNGDPEGIEAGVFMWSTATSAWCRITPTAAGNEPYGQPVTSLRVGPAGELYIGTVRGGQPTAGATGGVYKGTGSGCSSSWTWTKLLAQSRISSVVLSPINSSILYANSAQDNSSDVQNPNAGIYKSVNGGSSWSHLDLNGLMSLKDSVLDYESDGGASLTFYAATSGAGLYRATIQTPTTPANLTATAVPGRKINLAWQDTSNAEVGWIVEQRKGPNGVWTEVYHQDGPNKTSFTATGLLSGIYYYRVRAYDEAGNSAYSNLASATTIN